jgi:hypothetical protein
MITDIGYGTYFLFATFMVLMGVWAFFFVPETKGRSLEDMDRLFGVPERAGEGAGSEKAADEPASERIERI